MTKPYKTSSLVIAGFAASRLTRLVTEDYILDKTRVALMRKNAKLEYLLTCNACVSVYAGLIAALLPKRIQYALAISEAVVIARKLEDRV